MHPICYCTFRGKASSMSKFRPCACGCKKSVHSVDAKGRPRRFRRGHSSKTVPPSTVGRCARCGADFKKKSRPQKYCSERCRFPSIPCACGCGAAISKRSLEKSRGTRYLLGHHWIGRRHTEEQRAKIGQAVSGPRNGMWKGGTANLPYTYEFTGKRRKEIREEFKGRCGLCREACSGKFGHVHHIDYDRNNNRRENLILLCSRCHGRTNVDRDFWRSFLMRLRRKEVT